MRSNTKSLAVMLLLGCASAHKHHRHHQRLSSQFSENYDRHSMLQLYSHMDNFDDTEEYADNDILDLVQVDTKNVNPQPAKEESKPVDERTILNQLKQNTPAEDESEIQREKQIKLEEQAFAQPFLELGQSTNEYQERQHQKTKEIQNLLKSAVEGKMAHATQTETKPAKTAVSNAKNQIRLFQEDNNINENQEKNEQVHKQIKQKIATAVVPKHPAAQTQKATIAAAAPKETKAVPSIANTADLLDQSTKLLSATENLDNGKEVVVPKPLSNPKKIAQDIIKKHQMEMEATAQKQKKLEKVENDKDEFSQNLYEMSKQLLNSANEIEQETETQNAIKMQKEAEEQARTQKAYEIKAAEEKQLKKQQKKEHRAKIMHDLENASKVAGVTARQEVVAQVSKSATEKQDKKKAPVPAAAPVENVVEPTRIASPTDPDIMKAAEAAAAQIVANEKAMKEKEEESRPKTVLDEISSMVVKRAAEVERGPEDAKVQQLAIAQSKKQKEEDQTKYTPLPLTAMESVFQSRFELNPDQKKAMAAAETTSNSFLDRLNKVQSSPLVSLTSISNPFDGKIQKTKSEEQDMHQEIIKMQDSRLGMYAADVNV